MELRPDTKLGTGSWHITQVAYLLGPTPSGATLLGLVLTQKL